MERSLHSDRPLLVTSTLLSTTTITAARMGLSGRNDLLRWKRAGNGKRGESFAAEGLPEGNYHSLLSSSRAKRHSHRAKRVIQAFPSIVHKWVGKTVVSSDSLPFLPGCLVHDACSGDDTVGTTRVACFRNLFIYYGERGGNP